MGGDGGGGVCVGGSFDVVGRGGWGGGGIAFAVAASAVSRCFFRTLCLADTAVVAFTVWSYVRSA